MVTWKEIYGVLVSDEGEVQGYNIWIDSSGYPSVTLKGNKKVRVHRLVALAFIPNPNNLPEVNHKDRNKLNPRKSNLEWCTHAENVRHSSTKGVSRKHRAVLCVETNVTYPTLAKAAKAVKRSSMALYKCLHGWTKTCAGFHWRYVL